MVNKLRKRKGASLLDYGIIVAAITTVCLGAASFVGNNVADKFCDSGGKLSGAGQGIPAVWDYDEGNKKKCIQQYTLGDD